MRYELMVGLRYTRARRRNRFISINSLVSMIGIAVGVWALIVVLSVMNGFQKEVRERILGVASHVQISAAGSRLADWQSIAKIAEKNPHVLATAPFVQAQAMLAAGQAVGGALGRGILPRPGDKVADPVPHLPHGRLRPRQPARVGVEIEKRRMFIILTLIVLVAAINIISTLVVAVKDKQADIAILRTLGARPGSVMQIFIVQGMIIGVIGTLVGVGLGVITAINIDVIVPAIENVLGFKFLSKDVYLIPELPSDLQSGDVLAITAMALVLSFVGTLYPSWSASRTHPADALRYE